MSRARIIRTPPPNPCNYTILWYNRTGTQKNVNKICSQKNDIPTEHTRQTYAKNLNYSTQHKGVAVVIAHKDVMQIFIQQYMYPHYAMQCLSDISVFTMYQHISSAKVRSISLKTKTIAAFHIIQIRWFPSVCHTHLSKLLFTNRSIVYQRYRFLLLLHLTHRFNSALQQPNR